MHKKEAMYKHNVLPYGVGVVQVYPMHTNKRLLAKHYNYNYRHSKRVCEKQTAHAIASQHINTLIHSLPGYQ